MQQNIVRQRGLRCTDERRREAPAKRNLFTTACFAPSIPQPAHIHTAHIAIYTAVCICMPYNTTYTVHVRTHHRPCTPHTREAWTCSTRHICMILQKQ